jgi:hypothetical protein
VLASEALLGKYGIDNPIGLHDPRSNRRHLPPLRTWKELVAEAEVNSDTPTLLHQVFTPEEMEATWQKVSGLREEFDARHRLDAVEWSVCGVAGILAALVDIFLIQLPRIPGFFGSKPVEGGPLAQWIREKVNGTLTPEEIRRLEAESWVPYDAPTSSNLAQPVDGLSPSMHRFQALGHDPILGWIIGVKDILAGTFTAIDKHGNWIVQPVEINNAAVKMMGLFDAIGRQFGHLQSDITTPAGLPAPLMPLLQMCQFGQFGRAGYMIGDVARIMYRSGYDFRHFLAMSISPLLIEILVRLGYLGKRLYEGNSLVDAVPFEIPLGGPKPKLRTMLFTAHLIASAANAGKVAIGQNPLMINYPQWVALFRYFVPQLKWVLVDKGGERHRFVQSALDEKWNEVYLQLNTTWGMLGGAPVMLG